ncbi:MAG: Gfo/Idh/MocA family oxidoreductase [Candidatus Bathyarchaeia archaeon]
MAEKLRVAVVGLGKMGLMHVGILNTLPKVELVAVCEKNWLIRRVAKKVFKPTHVVDDLKKLRGLNLDAVYVTTPIKSHFPIVKAMYSEGITSNVFVEKTLASSFNEAKELCDLARKFGGINMVGYQRRFSVVYRKAKDLLDQKVIGKPILFEAYAYSSDFFGIQNSLETSTLGVDAIRDIGCHAIDVALWFFGELQIKSAKEETPANIHFECGGLHGISGKFSVSQCMKNYRMPEVGLKITGSMGIMEVNDDKLFLKRKDGKSSTWYRHDLGDNVAFLLGSPEYFREDEHFINSVLQGSPAGSSFDTAMKVDELIDQIMDKFDGDDKPSND